MMLNTKKSRPSLDSSKGNQSAFYLPDAVIFSSVSFLTTSSDDEGYHIVLHAHDLDRSVCLPYYKTLLTPFSQPDNQEDRATYFVHCREAAQPIVTVLAVVLERGGQLNDGQNLLHTVSRPPCTTRQLVPLTISPLWPVSRTVSVGPTFLLLIQTPTSFTGRMFSLTKKNRQLAIITDDVHFLQIPTQNLPPTPSSTTGKRRRVDRWTQRAGPITLTKTGPSNETSLINPLYSASTETNPLDVENKQNSQITWSPQQTPSKFHRVLALPPQKDGCQRSKKYSHAG
jgi:hypothetical protein